MKRDPLSSRLLIFSASPAIAVPACRTPSALDDDDGDDEEEVDDDFITDSRRRRPQATKRPTRRTAPPLADDTAQWNAGWFRDAQQADQGGMFEWARR